MRDVSQYFELIEKAIEYSPATEAEIEILRFDAKSGLIEGVLYFADGSRLEFTERVVIEQRRLVKQEYRYQFVRNEEAVFRYDNAPITNTSRLIHITNTSELKFYRRSSLNLVRRLTKRWPY